MEFLLGSETCGAQLHIHVVDDKVKFVQDKPSGIYHFIDTSQVSYDARTLLRLSSIDVDPLPPKKYVDLIHQIYPEISPLWS
jgi:hypothetical protein